LIKKNFENYGAILDRIMSFDEHNRLHRNKSSIKEDIRRKEIRNTVRGEITREMSKNSTITSPIMRTYATIELESAPLDYTSRAIEVPDRSRPFSKTTFTSVSPLSSRHSRAYSTDVRKVQSSRRLIHNTWIE
jgi:ribosomal protein S17E